MGSALSILQPAVGQLSIDNVIWRVGCQELPRDSKHSVILVANMVSALAD